MQLYTSGGSQISHVDEDCPRLSRGNSIRKVSVEYLARAGSRTCRTCSSGRPVAELLEELVEA